MHGESDAAKRKRHTMIVGASRLVSDFRTSTSFWWCSWYVRCLFFFCLCAGEAVQTLLSSVVVWPDSGHEAAIADG